MVIGFKYIRKIKIGDFLFKNVGNKDPEVKEVRPCRLVDFFKLALVYLVVRLLAAAQTKTLIGAQAIRFEVVPERRLAAKFGADPTTAPLNPVKADISQRVFIPPPAPFPYIT